MSKSNSVVIEEKIKLPIVEFSVGEVNDGAEFKFHLHKHQDDQGKSDERKKLVCLSSHLKYIGSNHEYDPSREHLKHYVALVNKKTGKKKIFPAEMFKMYPVIKMDQEVDSDVERQQAMKKVQEETRTFIERQDSLTDTFGSNKRRKAMATRQRNKVSDSTEAVKSAVEVLINEEGIADGAMAGEQQLSILPYDKEANCEEEVYALDVFIPSKVRVAASEAAQELISPSSEKIKEWKDGKNPLGTRYISWHASHAHPSVVNDSDIHTEYTSCLQILAYLIKLYAPTGSLAEKDLYIKEMSPVVQSWLVKEFTPDSTTLMLKRRLSVRMKDKILAYAVVLCWHIDSCQFDVQMLAEAFGISERKVSTVVRALGGNSKSLVQAGMKKTIGILKLPLDFPTPGKKRSR